MHVQIRKCGTIQMKCFKMKCTTPAGIYLLKVNNRNTRARCEICPKLIIKIPEASFWYLYC